MVTLIPIGAIGGGGSSGPVTSNDITDATTVGKQLVTATDPTDARSKIGAGTSSLTLGTTSSTAMAGNKTATDLGGVPSTRTVAGKPLSADVTLAASDVGAVPTTRTIVGKPLSADVTLTAADVNAVPSGRTVAGKALTSDITLAKADVGLGSVDNTADASKPVSTAQGSAMQGVTPFGYVLKWNTSTGWPARTTKPSWWTGPICYLATDPAIANTTVSYPADRQTGDVLFFRTGVMVS